MNSHSLVYLPALLVLSCGDKDNVVRDNDDSNDSSGPAGELLLGGDAGFTELADSCEEYARVNVGGNVSLDDSEASDLSSVDCLGSVSGDLVIEGEALTEIDLPNLDQIGGDLMVTAMDSLETLNMNALMSVGGSIQVQSNEYLRVASWSEICDVGASIAIELNLNLQQLDLGSNAVLNTLGEGLVVGDSLIITENPALVTLDIPMLTGINTFNENSARSSGAKAIGLVVEQNDSLEVLDLSALMGLAAPLKILENAKLTTINIEKTSMVGGDMLIAKNPKLLTLDFNQMTTVEGFLKISENPVLTSRPDDFSHLEIIEGDLTLEYLTSYYEPDFPSLVTVDGELDFDTVGVADKSAVQGEEGFSVSLPVLNSVGGEISFINVGARGLDLSSLATIPSDVNLIDNSYLSRLALADSLEWGGNLLLSGNPEMTNLEAFAVPMQLGGRLEIKYNENLASVNGLREVDSLRTNDKEVSGGDDCPDGDSPDFGILICGNPNLTYEAACETVSLLTELATASNEWSAYIYEGDECPDSCFDDDHSYGTDQNQICHSDNLDDDGDGYSEREGDCDDDPSTGDNTHPGAAEEEDNSEQCMTDNDGDGWGYCSPENGSIVPGTDCDDEDPDLNNDDVDGDGFSTCDGDCNDYDSDKSPATSDCSD